MSAENIADFDLVIVGAGLAGAALALAVADLPLKVALVEAQAVREGWPQNGCGRCLLHPTLPYRCMHKPAD